MPMLSLRYAMAHTMEANEHLGKVIEAIEQLQENDGNRWQEYADIVRQGVMEVLVVEDVALVKADKLQNVVKQKAKPRVLALDELQGYGHGWCEIVTTGDDEDPAERQLLECVWIRNMLMIEDGKCYGSEGVNRWYNMISGPRVWTEKPSEQLMESTAWGDAKKRGEI